MDELWDFTYGIYNVADGSIHRAGMSKEQAKKWLAEAIDIFPSGDPAAVWGLCRAMWQPIV